MDFRGKDNIFAAFLLSNQQLYLLPMLQTFQSEEARYNASLSVETLSQQESLDPNKLRIIRYSKPHDTCEGREIHLGNQAGGFPFDCLGHHFPSVEHLYLLGEWSLSGDEYKAIQEDVLTSKSGYAAKRFKKPKYHHKIREDFKTFRHQWMLWCIWQKCQGNKDFCQHLLSMPDDAIIVEEVPHDNIWAAYTNPQTGLLEGGNAVGKILTICRRCLIEHIEPQIDTELLNSKGLYILGERVNF